MKESGIITNKENCVKVIVANDYIVARFRKKSVGGYQHKPTDNISKENIKDCFRLYNLAYG